MTEGPRRDLEHRIWQTLRDHPGGLTAAEIGEIVGETVTSAVLKRLHSNGWIRRSEFDDPYHRISRWVSA